MLGPQTITVADVSRKGIWLERNCSSLSMSLFVYPCGRLISSKGIIPARRKRRFIILIWLQSWRPQFCSIYSDLWPDCLYGLVQMLFLHALVSIVCKTGRRNACFQDIVFHVLAHRGKRRLHWLELIAVALSKTE